MTKTAIPMGWKQVKLADVCKINMGQSPSSSAYNKVGNGLPLIQGNNDIKNGFTVSRIWTSEITKIAEKDSIILTVRAPVGTIGISHEKICIGRGVCSINSKNQDFIFYFLKYFEPKWANLQQGSTFSAINSADIRDFSIPLPPLPEQEKIVEVLETWDSYLEKLTHSIRLKKKIKKGLMEKLLTGKVRLKGFNEQWELVMLSNCFSNVGGTSLEIHVNKNGKYKFISIGNYSVNGRYVDNAQRIDLNKKTSEKLLNKGDLVMVLNDKTSKGTLIGASILIDADNAYIYNQRSERLVPKKNINSLFAWYLLNSDFRKKIYAISQGGTQIYVNFPSVKKLTIKLPSLPEQTAISQILTTADQEIETLEKKKSLVEQQKKFLLNNLITGRIRLPEFSHHC